MRIDAAALVESAKGQTCSGLYDLATKSFRLHWREIHNDPDEAEFFGNQAEDGQLLGVFCEGVGSFETSIDDHVFVGALQEMRLKRKAEGHKVDFRYLTEGAGVQHIAFTCKTAHAEKLDGGRVVRIPLNPDGD